MAEAHKCDRCGRFYITSELTEKWTDFEDEDFFVKHIILTGLPKIESKYDTQSRPFDLCPDCIKELLIWIRDSSVSIYKKER